MMPGPKGAAEGQGFTQCRNYTPFLLNESHAVVGGGLRLPHSAVIQLSQRGVFRQASCLCILDSYSYLTH